MAPPAAAAAARTPPDARARAERAERGGGAPPSSGGLMSRARYAARRAGLLSDEELVNLLSREKLVCMYLQPVDLVRVTKLVAPFSELEGHGMLRLKAVYFFISHSLQHADWRRGDNVAALLDLACWLAEDRDPGRRRTAHFQLLVPIARAAVALLEAGAFSVEQAAKLTWAYGRAGISPTEVPLWPAVIRFIGANLARVGVADLCRVLYALAEGRHSGPEADAAGRGGAQHEPQPQPTAAAASGAGAYGGSALRNELFTAAAARITAGVYDGSVALSSLDCATLAAAYAVAGVPAHELMGCLAHRATCAMLEHLPRSQRLTGLLHDTRRYHHHHHHHAQPPAASPVAGGGGGSGGSGWWMRDTWSLVDVLYPAPRGRGGGAGGDGASLRGGWQRAESYGAAEEPRGATAGGAGATVEPSQLQLGGGVTAGLYTRTAGGGMASSAEASGRLAELQRKIGRVAAVRGGDRVSPHDSQRGPGQQPPTAPSAGGDRDDALATAAEAGGEAWQLEGAAARSPLAAAARRPHYDDDEAGWGGGGGGGDPSAPPLAASTPKVSNVDARAWVMLAWSLAMQRAWTAGEGVSAPPVTPVTPTHGRLHSTAAPLASAPLAGLGSHAPPEWQPPAAPPAALQLPPDALAGTGAFFNVFRRLYPRMWQQVTSNARDVRRLLTVNACLRHLSPYPHLALAGAPPSPPVTDAAATRGGGADADVGAGMDALLSPALEAAGGSRGGGGPPPLHMGPEPPTVGEAWEADLDGTHERGGALDGGSGGGERLPPCVEDGHVVYVPEAALPPGSSGSGGVSSSSGGSGRAESSGGVDGAARRRRVLYGASLTGAAGGSSRGGGGRATWSSHQLVRVADPLGHSLDCEVPRRSESALVLQAGLQRAARQLQLEGWRSDGDGGGGGGGGGEEPGRLQQQQHPHAAVPQLRPSYLSADGLLFDFADPARRAGVLVVTPRMLRPTRDGLVMAVQVEYAAAVACGWQVHLVPAFELPRALLRAAAAAAAAVDGAGGDAGAAAAGGAAQRDDARTAAALQQIDALARRLLLDIAAGGGGDGGGGAPASAGDGGGDLGGFEGR